MKHRFMTESSIRVLIKGAVILSTCILAGFALIMAVYAIPVDRVRGNVEASLDTLISEGMSRYSIPGYSPSRMDNFTDAIMIGNAVIMPEDTLLRNALLAHRLDSLDPAGALRDYLAGSWMEGTYSYSVYWHGYLTFLKPLLCVLNYNSIRFLMMAVQVLLVVAAATLLGERGLSRYAIALFAMYISICPIAVMNTLTYNTVFVLGMGTAVLMLLAHERLEKWGYGYVFLVVGALTSYMDFLTAPVFSLGVPLTVYVLLVSRSEKRVSLLHTFGLCVAWGLGYGGMWAAKWVLVTLLTEVDGIREAFMEILYRTNNHLDNVGEVTQLAGIRAALELVLNPLNMLVLLGSAGICTVPLYKGIDRGKAAGFAALLLIALIPFAWMVFACNHTVSHAFFAYRCLGVSVFAGLCALLQIAKK